MVGPVVIDSAAGIAWVPEIRDVGSLPNRVLVAMVMNAYFKTTNLDQLQYVGHVAAVAQSVIEPYS